MLDEEIVQLKSLISGKGFRAPERTFKFPQGSGPVTSVKAMPNGRHLICASYDILRLYDLKEPQSTRSTVPFLIVPGHRTGVISQLYFDPSMPLHDLYRRQPGLGRSIYGSTPRLRGWSRDLKYHVGETGMMRIDLTHRAFEELQQVLG